MSAAILQFPVRPKAPPAPAKIDITEAECRLLDSTKAIIDHTLDVVNTDQRLIRGFLASNMMIQATFKHKGAEYNVRISLEAADAPGPRVA
ncbi:hypothetical protein EVB77_110 [Rhizobium phage RHph_N1_10]|nr:hypothetical protein EVB77_110 [Rhizobium phage RHph_N1_10]